jgi:hypothetical protein
LRDTSKSEGQVFYLEQARNRLFEDGSQAEEFALPPAEDMIVGDTFAEVRTRWFL